MVFTGVLATIYLGRGRPKASEGFRTLLPGDRVDDPEAIQEAEPVGEDPMVATVQPAPRFGAFRVKGVGIEVRDVHQRRSLCLAESSFISFI